ncbi:MAG: protein kinase, partial [Candidatus Sericytochromatia bacterium]|nr:protein kinase [Candidatus Sericytochromatia bacterium]
MFGSRYKEIKKLGQGGMGAVYLVHDHSLGRDLALKVIAAEVVKGAGTSSADAELLNSFRQEFRALTRLKHPNILGVFDFGITEAGGPYFTMEAIAGHELEAEPEASLPEIYETVTQICRALAFIHAHGVVHYDLKPPNIMIVDGERPVAKLMDFGLAGAGGESATGIKGTMAYMAPEMIRSEPTDWRADLYALGAMLYELVTGQQPFKADQTMVLLRQHLNDPPPLASRARAGIPARLDRLITDLMAKAPGDRPQSAMAVIAALDEIAGGGLPIEIDGTLEAYILSGSFTGREGELAQLCGMLDTMAGGGGLAVGVIGGAGVGKSRLLAEFRYHALLSGHRYFTAQFYEGSNEAYQSLRQILELVIWELEGPHPELLGAHAEILLEQLPHLNERPYMQGRKAFPPVPPDEQKARLFQYVGRFLVSAAQIRPMVLAIEDFHWADPLSEEFWLYLATQLPEAPLMMCITARRAALPDGIGRVELNPFTDHELQQYLESVFGISIAEPDAARLHVEAGGNALFTESVLRYLIAQRIISRSVTGWDVDTAAVASISIDSGLSGLLVDQFNRMSADDQHLLAVAATVGRSFTLDLLALALGQASPAVYVVLERLIDEQVLTKMAVGESYLYDLKINKFKDVIRTESADAEPTIHRSIALALETEYAGRLVEICERLAFHWREAGEITTAAAYALQAAPKNAAIFANQAAIAFYRQALEDPAHRDVAIEGLGDVLWVIGEYGEAIANYHDALAGYLGHGVQPRPQDFVVWQDGRLAGWQISTLRLSGTGAPDRRLAAMQTAQQRFDLGDYAGALERWRLALDTWLFLWQPLGAGGTLLNMALCAAALHHHQVAEALIERAGYFLGDFAPSPVALANASAVTRVLSGDLEAAMTLWRGVTQPTETVRHNLACVVTELGLYDQADSAWRELADAFPVASGLHRAEIRLACDDWLGASELVHALPATLSADELEQRLAICALAALGLGQVGTAAGHLAGTSPNRGLALEAQLRLAIANEAWPVFDVWLASAADGFPTAYWQAEAARRRGDAEAAINLFHEAQMAPTLTSRRLWQIYAGLAWAYQVAGQLEMGEAMAAGAAGVVDTASGRLQDPLWQARLQAAWTLPPVVLPVVGASTLPLPAWLPVWLAAPSGETLLAHVMAAAGAPSAALVWQDGDDARQVVFPADGELLGLAEGLFQLWRAGDASVYPGAWPLHGPTGVIGALVVAADDLAADQSGLLGTITMLRGRW